MGLVRRSFVPCVVATVVVTSAMVGVTAAASGPSPVSGWTAVQAHIDANTVAFDPTSGKLLAAIPSMLAGYGNDVVEVDPSTGAVGRAVYVGSDPTALAVSSDGTTLYVGFVGENRVVRVDLGAFRVVSSFTTPSDPTYGTTYAAQLAVEPGDDNSVIASLRYPDVGPAFANLVVFHNGVALPHTDPYPRNDLVDTFALGPGNTLYGYDNETSLAVLSTWTYDDQGVNFVGGQQLTLVQGTVTVSYAGGRIYFSSGAVVDAATAAVIRQPSRNDAAALPDLAANRVYVYDGVHDALDEYRADTFALVSHLSITQGAPAAVTVPQLTLVATSAGLAFSDGGLYLIGPSVGPAAAVDPPAQPEHLSTLAEGQPIPNLPLAALVDDAVTGRLLASVPTGAPKHADDVIEIDPAASVVTRAVHVGNDPGALALSDDGSTLYVARRAVPQVAIVDVATMTVRGTFSLGSDPIGFGPYYAGSMAVQPGHPRTVAIALSHPQLEPSSMSVGVFDDGVERPSVFTNPYSEMSSIAFSDATTIAAVDNNDESRQLDVVALDAAGAHAGPTVKSVATGPILGAGGGRIVMPYDVVDVPTLTVVAAFPRALRGVDLPNQRGYSADVQGNIDEFDLATGRFVASRPSSVTTSAAPAVVPTSVGLAVYDPTATTLDPLVASTLSVAVGWSAPDAARLGQIAAYLHQGLAATQRSAVALLAYLTNVAPSEPTTVTLPAPGTALTVTSSFATTDLPTLRALDHHDGTSDVDTVRLATYVLSYLLAITGH